MGPLMDLGQVEIEINRLYEELELAVSELGKAGATAASAEAKAELKYDRAFIALEGEPGAVPMKQAKAREFSYSARLAANVAKSTERTARANVSRIGVQLDVLRTLMSSLRKV